MVFNAMLAKAIDALEYIEKLFILSELRRFDEMRVCSVATDLPAFVMHLNDDNSTPHSLQLLKASDIEALLVAADCKREPAIQPGFKHNARILTHREWRGATKK